MRTHAHACVFNEGQKMGDLELKVAEIHLTWVLGNQTWAHCEISGCF